MTKPKRQQNDTTFVGARATALEALVRIDDGAYANLITPGLLDRSRLDERDRGFVTELVYGTTRMQRACDWLIDRQATSEIEPEIRRILRLGVYQLLYLDVAKHAAVNETVELAPRRARGFVNAILRRVGDRIAKGISWPSTTVELSYPDWIVAHYESLLGQEDARSVLAAMNQPARVNIRDDGYIQDVASQWVAGLVDVGPGDVVADVCAAPGGKATAIASQGAFVLAVDSRANRAKLIEDNRIRLDVETLSSLLADGRRLPLADGSVDVALVDAPCSGLGVLRRRPDARWRIQEEDIHSLAVLQYELLEEAVRMVKPGGRLVYSVCTLGPEENENVVTKVMGRTDFEALPLPKPWSQGAVGGRVVPTSEHDGMYVAVLRRP